MNVDTRLTRIQLSYMAGFYELDYVPPSTAGIAVYEQVCVVDRESFIAEYINLENPI